MINFWKLAYETVKKQRDQYKEERDTLIDDLSKYEAKVNRLEDEKDDMLLEREYYKNRYEDMTRICKEVERENEKLVWTLKNKEDVIDWNCLKIRGLKEDIEKYKRGTSNLINENDLKHNLLSEISQHIGNKPSSSTYKYFRAKLDALEIKEDE
ncbi:hypothetical protein P1A29_02250 [Staphylococcus equorum]|uniref:hypothetical protein n=1 Tax=Staphylococcus equorum TaxID=246432 RepID=UPI00255572AC|nr:hypothetical protein [Staphylococcus equorum]MDK9859262.1 hypothetical protein [Staphylococcus equorum]